MCIRAEWDTFVCLHADAVTALKADLLLPFPWSGVGLNQSSRVYSSFLRLRNPTEKERRSMTAVEKEQRRHLLMIQRAGPHHGGKVRMSHFPLCLSLHHLDPRKVGTSRCPVRNLSFSCPSAAPHPLRTKTAQRAIWLWVMEGGLNSPSEILEPVGKPQLFKCRKSWFYKMLTWSAQGTGQRMAERKTPPSSTPTAIYLETDSKGKGRGGGGGLWKKRGKLKRIIIIRRWRGCGKGPHLFPSNQVITLHLLIEPWSAKTSRTEEKWRGMTKQLNMALISSVWIPCISVKLSLPDFSMHSRHMRQMKFPIFIETRLFHASFPCTFMATILLSLTRLSCFEEMNKMK